MKKNLIHIALGLFILSAASCTDEVMVTKLTVCVYLRESQRNHAPLSLMTVNGLTPIGWLMTELVYTPAVKPTFHTRQYPVEAPQTLLKPAVLPSHRKKERKYAPTIRTAKKQVEKQSLCPTPSQPIRRSRQLHSSTAKPLSTRIP